MSEMSIATWSTCSFSKFQDGRVAPQRRRDKSISHSVEQTCCRCGWKMYLASGRILPYAIDATKYDSFPSPLQIERYLSDCLRHPRVTSSCVLSHSRATVDSQGQMRAGGTETREFRFPNRCTRWSRSNEMRRTIFLSFRKDIELSPSGLPRRGSSLQKLKDFASPCQRCSHRALFP